MRISDWSSDVCSSDLSFVKAIGQFTQQNLRVLRLSGQITIPRPGANLVEKVINRRCESQRNLHVADGAFKLISIDGTNGIGGVRLRREFGRSHADLLGFCVVRAWNAGTPTCRPPSSGQEPRGKFLP